MKSHTSHLIAATLFLHYILIPNYSSSLPSHYPLIINTLPYSPSQLPTHNTLTSIIPTFSIPKTLSLPRRTPMYNTHSNLPRIIAWRIEQPRQAAHQNQTLGMRFCTFQEPTLFPSFPADRLACSPNLSSV